MRARLLATLRARLGVRTLYVRNVPDDLYDELSARAKEEGTSLNAEATRLLRRALKLERPGQAAVVAAIRSRRAPLGADAPDPVNLLRADRDR